jgi:hypothetical protein
VNRSSISASIPTGKHRHRVVDLSIDNDGVGYKYGTFPASDFECAPGSIQDFNQQLIAILKEVSGKMQPNLQLSEHAY